MLPSVLLKISSGFTFFRIVRHVFLFRPCHETAYLETACKVYDGAGFS